MFKSRIKSLDILRGLCILLVIANHVGPELFPAAPELSPTKPTMGGVSGILFWKIKSLGWTGVDLFFILSGFLIGRLLLGELERTGGLDCVRFWVRRAFKIWPSYFALLLVLGVTGATSYLDTSSLPAALRSLVPHLLFLQNYLPHNANGPTWSLAVEEHFYLLLPPLLLGLAAAARRRGHEALRYLPAGVLGFFVVCLALRALRVATGMALDDYSRSHFRMDSLMLGVYCQYLCMHRPELIERLQAHRAPTLTLSAVLIAPALFLSRAHPFMFTVGFVTTAVAYALLLLLTYGGAFSRLESTRAGTALATVGSWSYNIYLWHFMLCKLNFPGFNAIANAWGALQVPTGIHVIGYFLILATFAIVVGWAATVLIEAPFLRLRQRVAPSRPQA